MAINQKQDEDYRMPLASGPSFVIENRINQSNLIEAEKMIIKADWNAVSSTLIPCITWWAEKLILLPRNCGTLFGFLRR